MEALGVIESLAPAAWLRRSFAAYPVVNAAHVMGIGALVACAMLIDLKILLPRWRTGRELGEAALRRVALVAFALALATGLLLFSVKAVEYAGLAVFRLKMALLALAGVNFLVFRLAPPRLRAAPAIHAALSLALWLGVLLAGRFIGFA